MASRKTTSLRLCRGDRGIFLARWYDLSSWRLRFFRGDRRYEIMCRHGYCFLDETENVVREAIIILHLRIACLTVCALENVCVPRFTAMSIIFRL